LNKAVIERGKALYDLKENAAFKIVLAEIQERMDRNLELLKGLTGTGVAVVPHYLNRYQAYNELLEWLDDEIEAGRREVERSKNDHVPEYSQRASRGQSNG
jgi:hypothetical protein